MSFDKLGVKELRRSAEEDFAVEIDPKANKQEVLAALAESGVTWDLYLEAHPEVAAAEAEAAAVAEAPETTDNGVVTAAQMAQPEAPVETKIVVKEEVPLQSREEWLIKMVRANPLYEVRGHRFTQENPFALVSPADAEYLLTREDGFRQATPTELQTYYG